jgi:uncharacterized protein (DUF111 family)
MNPEIYPYVIEKLLAGGARDAFIIPVIMKKGRPGILIDRIGFSTAATDKITQFAPIAKQRPSAYRYQVS